MSTLEEKMKRTVEILMQDLASIRSGRPNPAILDKVTVDYYGVPTPVTQIAGVSVSDAHTISIQPWDGGVLGALEKAILKSDIGLTPNNDGKVIRLNFPPLTEERRKELSKNVAHRGEEAKVAVRNARRDEIEHLKVQKKNSEITEDDLKDSEEETQKTTDKFIKEIDDVVAKKEKEILEV